VPGVSDWPDRPYGDLWIRLIFPPKLHGPEQRRAGFLFFCPPCSSFSSVLPGFRCSSAWSARSTATRLPQARPASSWASGSKREASLGRLHVWTSVAKHRQPALDVGARDRDPGPWRRPWDCNRMAPSSGGMCGGGPCYFLPFSASLVAAALIWQWIYDPVYGFLNFLPSPGRHPAPEVDAELDPGAPVHCDRDVWVPWGLTHDHSWRPLQSYPRGVLGGGHRSTAPARGSVSGTSPCRS